MGPLYDTHFHLDLQKDRTSAIRRIEEKQIYTIAVTNLPDLYRKESIEIASKYIRIGLGFHPELVHEYKSHIPLMWNFLPESRYIGEVGLDFSDRTYANEQVDFFTELIDRCRFDRNKILSIHSRRAVSQVLEVLGNNFRFKAILHWFSGSNEELMNAIQVGCYFSINHAMMKSSKFMGQLPLIPKERLLLESDSPFTGKVFTHDEMILKTVVGISSYSKEVNLWNNFRNMLV